MAFNFSQPYIVLTVLYKPTGEIRKIKDYRYDARVHEIVKKSDYVDRQEKPKDLVANAVTAELKRQADIKKVAEAQAVEAKPEIEIIDVPVKKAKKKRVTRKKKSS